MSCEFRLSVRARRAIHGSLVAWVLLGLASGCGGGLPRQLTSTGADSFTLFPDRDAPSPTSCDGPRDTRFRCLSEELDEHMSRMDVSGALTVVERGREPLSYVRSPDGRSVTADTRFYIASVSKMFLGLAAVSLAQDGSLDLHAPIETYLETLPDDAELGRVTLHELLTHTSGIAAEPSCCDAATDIDDVVRAYGDAPLWAPAGEVYNYSNLGYAIAAAVLERVARKPFEAIVAERVIQPLGIAAVSYDDDLVQLTGHPPPGVASELHCRASLPAGGLTMTIAELGRFLQAMLGEAPALDAGIVAATVGPHVETGQGFNPAYGYGVSHLVRDDITLVGHGGGHSGFSAFIGWVPDRGFGVAAVADVPAGVAPAGGLRAASTFLGVSADWSPPPRPAHRLQDYIGTYVDEVAGLGEVRISLEGEHLVLDYPSGPPPLLPPEVTFAFVSGETQARYLVTGVGVAERRPGPASR